MTLKERIADLFETYSVNLSVEDKEKAELAEAKLANGQEVMTDAEAFAIGASVFVMNDENEQIPLPSGEYEMEDGQVMVVEDGVISAMNAAPEEAEEDKEEEMAEEPVAEQAVEEVAEEQLTAESVKAMIAEAIAEIKQEFSAQMEKKEEQITELSKQAAEKPLPRAPRAKKTFTQADMSQMSVQERIEAIANQFTK